MAEAAPPWTCPACRTRVETAFCAGCGERPLHPPDLTLKGLSAQLLKSLSGVDGRVLASLRQLVTRPGALTEAHRIGLRKPYVGPFQIFFIVNLLFFTLQSLTHTKIFSSSLDSHLHHQDWSSIAQPMVARHLAAKQTTLALYAPLFDQAVVLNAKSMVILMVLPFVLLLPLIFHRSRSPFGIHLAFALHAQAFLLLWFCLALGVVAVDLSLGGAGLASTRMDHVLTGINLLAFAVYVYIAAGRVYAGGRALRAAQALVLALCGFAIVLGYRFAVFAITLAIT